MNASEYRKQKQDEIVRLINDAYLIGMLHAKGQAPAIAYESDLKKLKAAIQTAMATALRATAP